MLTRELVVEAKALMNMKISDEDVYKRQVQIDRFFGFFEVFFERDEVGQDVSPAQTDPAERLRRYQAQSDETAMSRVTAIQLRCV